MKRSLSTSGSPRQQPVSKMAKHNAPTPVPGHDFTGFKLVRVIPTKDEDDEEEDEGNDNDDENDPELDIELRWLRRVAYNIVGPDAKVFGQLRLWLIDVEEIRDRFYAEMDLPSSECMRFAFTLFDENGYLRDEWKRPDAEKLSGASWGFEVDSEPLLAYLDEIEIDRTEQGKGVGSWALREIWRSRDGLDVEGLEDIAFLFAFPAPLPAAADRDFWRAVGPIRSDEDMADPEKAARVAADEIKGAKVVSFFRKANFRRVGNTKWFCCARDPNHQSRRVPISNDADYKEPETLAEMQAAMRQDDEVFGQMRRQAGW